MNENRVKLVLRSAEENISVLINKFLDAETLSALDLYWWWDPSQNWWVNKKYVNRALKILVEEQCLKRISTIGRDGIGYRKTEEFVNLLQKILQIEDLLG